MSYVRTLPVVPRGAALPVPRGVLGELSPDTKRVLVTGTVISLIALTFALAAGFPRPRVRRNRRRRSRRR